MNETVFTYIIYASRIIQLLTDVHSGEIISLKAGRGIYK
jgi:hypothetical protein